MGMMLWHGRAGKSLQCLNTAPQLGWGIGGNTRTPWRCLCHSHVTPMSPRVLQPQPPRLKRRWCGEEGAFLGGEAVGLRWVCAETVRADAQIENGRFCSHFFFPAVSGGGQRGDAAMPRPEVLSAAPGWHEPPVTLAAVSPSPDQGDMGHPGADTRGCGAGILCQDLTCEHLCTHRLVLTAVQR